MINFDDVTKENIKKHNPNSPQIPDHPYRILIIGRSGSGKINSLFNLMSHQLDTDKIYLYAKDPYEAKHQLLINNAKIQAKNILIILKPLLNTQMIWMIFIKILKNTTE